MLLGDTDVEGAFRETGRRNMSRPRARRHGGGDRHDLRVDLSVLDQFLGRRPWCSRGGPGLDGLGLLTRDHVELHNAVVLVGGVLGGAIALALFA